MIIKFLMLAICYFKHQKTFHFQLKFNNKLQIYKNKKLKKFKLLNLKIFYFYF